MSNLKRVLSLLLTLAMVLSLGVLPASAEDVEFVEVTEPAPEIDEAAYPAQQFSYYEPNGLSIDVKAPAGALPRGTTMEVSRLEDLSRVQNAVDRADDLSGSVVLAADIAFWNDGAEVEPVEGSKILVTMTAPEIAEVLDPVVVHVPDEEPAVAERIEPLPEDESALRMGDQISFEAESFSVYAVIGGSEDDHARLKVTFMNGDAELAVMYLKKADLPSGDNPGHVNEILYDPGVPVDDEKLFMGWTTEQNYTNESEGLSIDRVRELAVERLNGQIMDGESELILYAKMLRVYYLYYEGESGIIFKTETVLAPGASASFTVNAEYTPANSGEGFIGWLVKGTTEPVYRNGSTITLTDNTTLVPKTGVGHWIYFDENDGGSGTGDASYTPPAFVSSGETAVNAEPGNPTRPGYSFAGWYTEAEGGSRFDFNRYLDDLTESGITVYAHWTANETAEYKVVIWVQSVDDDKDAEDANKTYDYFTSFDLTAATDTQVTKALISAYTGFTDSDFGVSDLDHGSKAFRYSRFDVKKGSGANKDCISATGQTVVNVRYDRRLFTIQFNGAAGGSSQTYYEPVDGGADVYGLIDGEYVRLSVSTVKRVEWGTHSTYGNAPAMPNPLTNVRLATKSSLLGEGSDVTVASLNLSSQDICDWQYKAPNGKQIFTTNSTSSNYRRLMWRVQGEYSYSYNGEPYTGQVYQKVTVNALLFTGLYGQSLSKYKYTWPEGSWYSIAFLNSFNGNLFGHSSLGSTPNKIVANKASTTDTTIIFYVQDPNNLSSYPEAARASYSVDSDQGFNITERFVGTVPVCYKWSTSEDMPGGTWDTGIGSDGYTSTKRGNITYLHIKYDLQKFDIVFMNGDTEVKRVEDIPYSKSLVSYESEKPVLDAGDDSHYFAGWFEDPSGQQSANWNGTMPLANKVFYASVLPVQYHVIVNLKGGSLPEGTSQKLSFWVPYETVLDDTEFNKAFYTADDHHSLVGFFTDEDCMQPWNFDTRLTGESLTITYAGPEDETRRQYDDYGYPSTVGVFMLYAKWRDDDIATGGGIQIRYAFTDHSNNDATAYKTDPLRYADAAIVIATAAPQRSTWPEGMMFKCWRLGGHDYYPTQSFYADSQYVEMLDGVPTITLTAVYEEIDPELPTHIYWYANNGTSDVQMDRNVQVNKGIPIPSPKTWVSSNRTSGSLSYEGHVFLGWARLPLTEGSEGGEDHPELTEDDLFLRWVADASETDGGHFEALVTKTPLTRDFYLVGWINGGDYGGDAYKFDSETHQLTVSFTADTYVAVKPAGATDIGQWYFTNGWLGFNTTSCTLRQDYGQDADKLYVPTGTTLTFEIKENDDGSLTLSYTAAASGNSGNTVSLRESSASDPTMEWTRVEYVAADEELPYHDMYAVWASVFYVYHSGTNKVERVLCTSSIGSFDLTALVDTDNFLYGGYYTSYAGASSTFTQDHEALSWTEVASVSGYHDVAQINTIAAKGCVAIAVDNGSGAVPYTGQQNAWIADDVCKTAGNAVTPTAGMVYYIKEVPASDFLQPKMKFTYIKSTGKIGTSWLFTNMDDTNYGDVGFMVGSTKVVGDQIDSVVITPLNTGVSTTFTVADLFPKGGAKMSYKMVYNDMSTYPSTYDGDAKDCDTLKEGSTVCMFWVTPDGMMVTSTAVRTYTNITVASGYTGGMQAAKDTQASTISVYQAS